MVIYCLLVVGALGGIVRVAVVEAALLFFTQIIFFILVHTNTV